jgi:hypothetical protein
MEREKEKPAKLSARKLGQESHIFRMVEERIGVGVGPSAIFSEEEEEGVLEEDNEEEDAEE